MLFISLTFIIFLLIIFPIYFVISNKFKWIFLLICSYIYYGFANPKFLIFLIISTISTYFVGIKLNKLNKFEEHTQKNVNFQKKCYLILALIINLGLVFCFKQINFINNNLSLSFILNLAVPLGISYYTLQALGYTIDIYRKVAKPETNIAKYALFVSYFPQFVMGPISRFNELHYQFFEKHNFNKEQFIYGIRRILYGFFKKLVIADRIGIFTNTIYSNYNEFSGTTLVLTIILYTFQLYADFSGYMDIAIGVSNCFGITIQENFKSPFFSKSIQEFWTRWHITLYTWFKDYVFYPIIFSKFVKKLHGYLKNKNQLISMFPAITAIMIVWFFVGLWHGYQPHYIINGLYNGMLIVIYMFIQKYDIFKNLNVYIKTLFTFIVVVFGIFILTVPSLTDLGNILHRIVQYPISNNILSELNISAFLFYDWWIIVLGITALLVVDFLKYKNKFNIQNIKLNFVIMYALLLAVVVCGIFGETTFIYLRF